MTIHDAHQPAGAVVAEAAPVPRVAALAFNVKGADLLFLDHLYHDELEHVDYDMWHAAEVDVHARPFGRVLVYAPLAADGVNLNTLRNNPNANIEGYSETRAFAFGISQLWPHLDLLFDDRSSPAAALLAEVRHYFEQGAEDEDEEAPGDFTLANVLNLFDRQLRRPKPQRKDTRWEYHNLNVIDAVYQRLRALGALFGGLVDHTGTGFGLDQLTRLDPYDLVVVDLERIMADPPDPEMADKAIKIVTKYVLQRLTEAVTRGLSNVDHVIVFADELNRLAPERGETGVGEYLANLARTTRDRGVVLFGAGQFRSGIKQDILKAASVHYSMQTPEYELRDPMYSGLSAEFKARLTQLQPGETMIQFPSLRTPVFARFPRPYVFTGTRGRLAFPPVDPRDFGECIAERLAQVDRTRLPLAEEVQQLVAAAADAGGGRRRAAEREILQILRGVEMEYAAARTRHQRPERSPWEKFRQMVQTRRAAAPSPGGAEHALITDVESPPDTMAGFGEDED